ncbi:MAG: helix-turn-helix transcriptional regulator [Rhodospirillales bacterium]|nr:helix-turn-helix transcriptional regulator [Rhodospirillales bacterium]
MRITPHLDAEIGNRLRQARLVENLTQDDLARKLGISFQQVQKYENGVNRVSSSRLWTVSRVLGLPITYFYEGLDVGHISDAIADADQGVLPDSAIRVARLLHALPDGDIKTKIYDLIKAVSKTTVSSQGTEGQKGEIIRLQKVHC